MRENIDEEPFTNVQMLESIKEEQAHHDRQINELIGHFEDQSSYKD